MNYANITQPARDAQHGAKLVSDVKMVQTVLEQYYQDTGHYPVLTEGELEIMKGTILDGQGWKNSGDTTSGKIYLGGNSPIRPTEPMYYQGGSGRDKYSMEFSLGTDAGSFRKGTYCAIPKEIRSQACATVTSQPTQ